MLALLALSPSTLFHDMVYGLYLGQSIALHARLTFGCFSSTGKYCCASRNSLLVEPNVLTAIARPSCPPWKLMADVKGLRTEANETSAVVQYKRTADSVSGFGTCESNQTATNDVNFQKIIYSRMPFLSVQGFKSTL